MRLVDTLAEQQILEDLIEDTKPRLPPGCAGLHYLLATPFRYVPIVGSRWRRAGQRDGVFYAAEHLNTALAELAFYRLLFFIEAPGATPPRKAVEHTAFSAAVASNACQDLTVPPFDTCRSTLTHPTDYGPTRALADEARQSGVQIILYESIRDPQRGRNVAVMTPVAFAQPNPLEQRTWHFQVRPKVVHVWQEFPKTGLEFPADVFAVDQRVVAYLKALGP